jgi:5-methylcytosine-specific restriction endonuclease McrA
MIPFLPKRPRIRLASEDYKRLLRQTLERDSWRCQQCGRASGLQVHHIRFRSLLGDDDLNNLITLCHHCHEEEHGRTGQKK